jgi:hypothetical protein
MLAVDRWRSSRRLESIATCSTGSDPLAYARNQRPQYGTGGRAVFCCSCSVETQFQTEEGLPYSATSCIRRRANRANAADLDALDLHAMASTSNST